MNRRRRRSEQRERGQILVIAALLLPILLGFAALAIDIGTYAAERRTLQNNADSIALAAGRGLPDNASVQSLASSWAAKNGVSSSQYSVAIVNSGTVPTVRVTISKPHQFFFIRILGVADKDVGAIAAAQKLAPATGRGVVPWSVTDETVNAASSGSMVTVKYDANANYGQGNFGAIRIDGNGASTYEESAKYGSTSQICSVNEPNCEPTDCPGTYPSTCGENAPDCDGYDCTPKTGNMTGPTKDAVDFRMDNTSDGCDTFSEAFTAISTSSEVTLEKYVVGYAGTGGTNVRSAGLRAPEHHGAGGHPTYTPTQTPTRTNTPTPTYTATVTNTPTITNTPTNTPTAGPTNTNTPGPSPTNTNTSTPAATWTPGSGGYTYGLNPDCNPWSGGACPPSPSSADCSRRVFLIPIVDDFGNGSSDPVTILGFALVYLEGYTGSCTGNSCDVQARFVRADVTTGAFTGAYDPTSALQFVKLTE